ncbi:MAG: hypothetical protein JW797_16845 [Bradymonadales bacterium]|nr:hypothetical protein [Bradymonadales bacterium]
MALRDSEWRLVRRGSSWLTLLLAISAGVFLLRCGSDVAVQPRALFSPAGVASVRRCEASQDGEQFYVAPERCEEGGDISDGTINTLGLITNRERESLMVVPLDTSLPILVDLDRGEPNITGIPICAGPSQVGVTPDGLFALVLCDASRSLSVVVPHAYREVLRLQRGAVETDMAIAPDQPLVAFVRPDLQQVRVERLSWECEGVTDRIPMDCLPQVQMEVEATFDTAFRPTHLAFGSQGRLYVSYQDQAYLSVFSLDDQQEAACLDGRDLPPCETARIGLTFECSNGLDDDGDGLADQLDPQCFGPEGFESTDSPRVMATACTDGLDNDGDGLTDHQDPGCLNPLDQDEGGGVLPPEMLDDLADDWFADPGHPWNSNGWVGELPACSNGIDDDGDGVADHADPGCSDPRDDSEEASPPVCADGVDNDGDGWTDTDDPDCYGAAGQSEASLVPFGLGPVSVSRSGEYLLVVDRTQHQLLVVDLEAGVLMDVGAVDPIHNGLGIGLSRSALKRPLGYTWTAITGSSTAEEMGYEEELVIAPSSDGYATLLTIRTTVYTGIGEDRVEGVDFPLRPRDGNQSQAQVSNLSCTLPQEYQSAIRTARGTSEAVRIRCDASEVPQLATLESDQQVDLASEPHFTLIDGLLAQETVPADWRIRSEEWTLSYEGIIPGSQRNDGLIDDTYPGILTSAGVNYCSLGIVASDRLVIAEATPLLTAPTGACAPFEGEDRLEYEIAFVRADALYLRVLEGEDGVVQQLPDRQCFGAGFSYEIRPHQTWLVSGSSSGFLHPQTTLVQQCVPRTADARWTGRLRENELFDNPFLSLQLRPGTVEQPPDTAITFSVRSNFSTTALGIGPLPVDIHYAVTSRGPLILLSDGGTNAVYLFDAESFLLLTSLL